MGGRVDIRDRHGGRDVGRKADRGDRIAGQPLGIERIAVADEVALGFQDLGVGQADAFLAFGRDGKDPGPEEIPAHVFEDGRILEAADDVLIDFLRLLGIQDLARDLLFPDPHREFRDRRTLGQGENVGPLDVPLEVIEKHLIDRSLGHLVRDLDGDAVILDRERRDLISGPGRPGNDEAVGE